MFQPIDRPGTGRWAKQTAVLLAALLFALLAVAPAASAAPDPLASGSTTIKFRQGFIRSLKRHHVRLGRIAPATVKGRTAVLSVSGGELDPTTGAGTVAHSGGLKFKRGKRKAPVSGLTIDTTKKALFAKIGHRKLRFAQVGGWRFVRDGFGVDLVIKKLKITKAAAKQLNKRLGFRRNPKAFFGNRVIAAARSETQPATVTIVPTGNVSFDANQQLLLKLKDVETEAQLVPPTTSHGLANFEFPISGGEIAPDASAGVVQTAGGADLFQKLPKSATESLETKITLGNFYVDLGAHTISVEVVTQSNAAEALNRGALGRASVADLTLTGATVAADPTAHTVTVQNATATLQPIAAEVLEGFVKVYEGWYAGVYKSKNPTATEQEVKEAAAKRVEKDNIAAGEPLGVFSFTAQTQ